MYKGEISSFKDFVDQLDYLEMMGYEINVFRGQSNNDPLLPNICRASPNRDCKNIERKMLDDLYPCYQVHLDLGSVML